MLLSICKPWPTAHTSGEMQDTLVTAMDTHTAPTDTDTGTVTELTDTATLILQAIRSQGPRCPLRTRRTHTNNQRLHTATATARNILLLRVSVSMYVRHRSSTLSLWIAYREKPSYYGSGVDPHGKYCITIYKSVK